MKTAPAGEDVTKRTEAEIDALLARVDEANANGVRRFKGLAAAIRWMRGDEPFESGSPEHPYPEADSDFEDCERCERTGDDLNEIDMRCAVARGGA